MICLVLVNGFECGRVDGDGLQAADPLYLRVEGSRERVLEDIGDRVIG